VTAVPAEAEPTTYAEGGMPDSERIEDIDTTAGFKVGDTVEFVEDFADDVPAGRRAVIDRIDDHPVMPLSVLIFHPGGAGFYFSPVKPTEVRKVDDDKPAESAQDAPEASTGTEGDGPQAVAA
jgi:hypothetical protein